MNKHRLHFSKTGRACYISHLDLMRTFQRAFLRADIPIKHTEGFNPHAFVSIPLPLSVGFSSGCEILDFELVGDTDLEDVPRRLNAVLPEGIVIHRCYEAVRPIRELAYVDYAVRLEYDGGVPAGAQEEMTACLGREDWVVSKHSKKAKSGMVEIDLIPLVKEYSFTQTDTTLTLRAILSAQNPGLNPQVLWTALSAEAPGLTADFVQFHRNGVLDAQLGRYE